MRYVYKVTPLPYVLRFGKLYAGLKQFLDFKETKNTFEIIYYMGTDDKFTSEINRSVSIIEDYLRPHMK